jgi:predicted rRNA methylase YqxC with S4 and FtsJ domains
VQDGGVVLDAATHDAVLNDMRKLWVSLGREVKGLIPSPITGQKSGNVEFLLWG